jgi:hypothetical protein
MLAAMETMLRSSMSFATNPSGVKEEVFLRRQGQSKIVNAVKEAQSLGPEYIWIETCYIGKSSSAELQKAINSMYRWHKEAEVCIVYLDIWSPKTGPGESHTAPEIARRAFESSRWTRRGWTPQELVALAICRFYLRDWRLLDEKEEFSQRIPATTDIPVLALEEHHSLSEVSVAERMSWPHSARQRALRTASIVFLSSSISRCRCCTAKDQRHPFGSKKKSSRTLTTTASSPGAFKTPLGQLTEASLLVNPSGSGTASLSSRKTPYPPFRSSTHPLAYTSNLNASAIQSTKPASSLSSVSVTPSTNTLPFLPSASKA